MGKIKTTYKIKFGKNADMSYWGRRGCSHGMYNRYSYDFYVYGIKGIFNFTKLQEW